MKELIESIARVREAQEAALEAEREARAERLALIAQEAELLSRLPKAMVVPSSEVLGGRWGAREMREVAISRIQAGEAEVERWFLR